MYELFQCGAATRRGAGRRRAAGSVGPIGVAVGGGRRYRERTWAAGRREVEEGGCWRRRPAAGSIQIWSGRREAATGEPGGREPKVEVTPTNGGSEGGGWAAEGGAGEEGRSVRGCLRGRGWRQGRVLGHFIQWQSAGNYPRTSGVNSEWILREATEAPRGGLSTSGFCTLYEEAVSEKNGRKKPSVWFDFRFFRARSRS